ncbi:hypothetical protein Thermus77412_24970 [Thermus antranikianii]
MAHRLRRGEGISWHAAEEGIHLIGSGDPGGLAYLGVAVHEPEGGLLGVVSLYLPGNRAALSPETRESLTLLAEVAGILLARRRSLQRAQAQAHRSRMLLQLT